MAEGYLAVARLRKPHGLKGDALMWALTDEPSEVLAAGRQLVPVDDAGRQIGDPVTIERSRPYQRLWLVKFKGVPDRPALDEWRNRLFGVPAESLVPPQGDEWYLHELPGASVKVGDELVGTVRELVDVPGGVLLAVDVGGRDVLVPFRRPIVTKVDRSAREIEIDPPDGLLDL